MNYRVNIQPDYLSIDTEYDGGAVPLKVTDYEQIEHIKSLLAVPQVLLPLDERDSYIDAILLGADVYAYKSAATHWCLWDGRLYNFTNRRISLEEQFRERMAQRTPYPQLLGAGGSDPTDYHSMISWPPDQAETLLAFL